ncbi:aldo-keto reductase [Tanacetum coccineum]
MLRGRTSHTNTYQLSIQDAMPENQEDFLDEEARGFILWHWTMIETQTNNKDTDRFKGLRQFMVYEPVLKSSRKVRSKRKMYKPEAFEISKFSDAVGIDKSGVHLPSFSHKTVMPKVSGPSGQMTWIRGCPTSLDNWNIHIDNSLLRAQTGYIDIYQLLWPDRYVPMFGETYYDPARQYSYISFDEQLATLGKVVDVGKNQGLSLLADCNLAIALDGDYMKAISRRANLNEKIRDYEEATLDFQRLVHLLEKRRRRDEIDFREGLAICIVAERLAEVHYEKNSIFANVALSGDELQLQDDALKRKADQLE